MNWLNRSPKPTHMTYEAYEAWISSKTLAGFGVSLDTMRACYAYYISPCSCAPKCYARCKGWELRVDLEMAKDLVDIDDIPLSFQGWDGDENE